MKLAITLIRAVIILALTYLADVWIRLNKVTENYLQVEYKAMVYFVMDLLIHTKWRWTN